MGTLELWWGFGGIGEEQEKRGNLLKVQKAALVIIAAAQVMRAIRVPVEMGVDLTCQRMCDGRPSVMS